MKYRCELVVNVPRGKFIELFDNPANMPKWMTGLQAFEPISGTQGQPGAKSRLVFLMGKKPFKQESMKHMMSFKKFAESQ